jgi:hypothetical protein
MSVRRATTRRRQACAHTCQHKRTHARAPVSTADTSLCRASAEAYSTRTHSPAISLSHTPRTGRSNSSRNASTSATAKSPYACTSRLPRAHIDSSTCCSNTNRRSAAQCSPKRCVSRMVTSSRACTTPLTTSSNLRDVRIKSINDDMQRRTCADRAHRQRQQRRHARPHSHTSCRCAHACSQRTHHTAHARIDSTRTRTRQRGS